ncbi:hypothetical protein KSS87_021759, partial [Heliosperma pusillum]
ANTLFKCSYISKQKKIFNELRWLDLAGCHHCQLCEYEGRLIKYFVQVQPHQKNPNLPK